MNIHRAKTQIKNAISAYLTKNEYGEPIISMERQRPVFLMGPPGIGKTAVMAQISAELNIGLIAYSMTHHTRQSALGLPFISHKIYEGKEYNISEYTMSEIIASVYDLMEKTGVKSGILFLDEINCVSETLAPVMLQFLQYKIFGKHKIPDNWILVAAGNPPEYNKSVREFDIVTWDRLKRIDIEPDFNAWKEFAYEQGVHPAVLTYLEIKKSDFYSVESTVNGKTFVTARGWCDLSDIIKIYEKQKIAVDSELIIQYLQKPGTAKSFSVYYDLFNKYRADYQADKILAGKTDAEIKARAANAGFDERLALIGLLLDSVTEDMRETLESDEVSKKLLGVLKTVAAAGETGGNIGRAIKNQIETLNRFSETGKISASISDTDRYIIKRVAAILDSMGGVKEFTECGGFYNHEIETNKKNAAAAGEKLKNLFVFCEETFTKEELSIVAAEITVNRISSNFIARYGSKEYFRLNKSLMLSERGLEITAEIKTLEDQLFIKKG